MHNEPYIAIRGAAEMRRGGLNRDRKRRACLVNARDLTLACS